MIKRKKNLNRQIGELSDKMLKKHLAFERDISGADFDGDVVVSYGEITEVVKKNTRKKVFTGVAVTIAIVTGAVYVGHRTGYLHQVLHGVDRFNMEKINKV